MQILKTETLSNGATDNRLIDNNIGPIDGWAYLPESKGLLENFPFGSFSTIKGNWPNGKEGLVVQEWYPVEIPEPEGIISPIKPEEPTELDKLQAQVLYTAVLTDTLLVEEEEDT